MDETDSSATASPAHPKQEDENSSVGIEADVRERNGQTSEHDLSTPVEERPGYPWAPSGGEIYVVPNYYLDPSGKSDVPTTDEVQALRGLAGIAEAAVTAVFGNDPKRDIDPFARSWTRAETRRVHLAAAELLSSEDDSRTIPSRRRSTR